MSPQRRSKLTVRGERFEVRDRVARPGRTRRCASRRQGGLHRRRAAGRDALSTKYCGKKRGTNPAARSRFRARIRDARRAALPARRLARRRVWRLLDAAHRRARAGRAEAARAGRHAVACGSRSSADDAAAGGRPCVAATGIARGWRCDTSPRRAACWSGFTSARAAMWPTFANAKSCRKRSAISCCRCAISFRR